MEWLRKFMLGRYGTDSLSNTMVIGALILRIFLLRFIKNKWIFNIVDMGSLLLIIFAYYRVFSKNITKRYGENMWFKRKTRPIRNLFKSGSNKKTRSKNYKYFKCSKCKQEIRVPKGKGNLIITCPKCKNKMNKKS